MRVILFTGLLFSILFLFGCKQQSAADIVYQRCIKGSSMKKFAAMGSETQEEICEKMRNICKENPNGEKCQASLTVQVW